MDPHQEELEETREWVTLACERTSTVKVVATCLAAAHAVSPRGSVIGLKEWMSDFITDSSPAELSKVLPMLLSTATSISTKIAIASEIDIDKASSISVEKIPQKASESEVTSDTNSQNEATPKVGSQQEPTPTTPRHSNAGDKKYIKIRSPAEKVAQVIEEESLRKGPGARKLPGTTLDPNLSAAGIDAADQIGWASMGQPKAKTKSGQEGLAKTTRVADGKIKKKGIATPVVKESSRKKIATAIKRSTKMKSRQLVEDDDDEAMDDAE